MLDRGEDPQGIHQEMEKGYRWGLARACRQIDDDLIQVVPMTEEDYFRRSTALESVDSSGWDYGDG